MILLPKREKRLAFALSHVKREDMLTLLDILEKNGELILCERLKYERSADVDNLFITYESALALYFLSVFGKEENREEYKERAKELFLSILSLREELYIRKPIMDKYGYEMLPPINENNIAELKQSTTLLIAVLAELTSSTLPIRELYEFAATLDEDSAVFYGVTDRESLDALYMLAVFIDCNASSKYLNNVYTQDAWQKEGALAKSIIFRILERDERHARANFYCYKQGYKGSLSKNEYLERSLPSFTGLKMLFTVIFVDKYAAIFAAPVLAKKEAYLEEYLKTTDVLTTALCCNFLRWHPYEAWIYKDSHTLAAKVATKFVHEPMSKDALVMLSKSLFFIKDEYPDAYATVFSRLLEMGDSTTLLSRACDEIDAGINVEENMEAIKSSAVCGAKEVYEYKKTGDKSVLKGAAWELAKNAWLAQRELWKSSK